MENNNNIHSFDEHFKQAMEQFQPTPPADVWANVSSQIGNVTAASQATLVSKIATILTKKVVLISSVAAVVSSVAIYVFTTDKVENTPTILIGTPIKIETPVIVQNNNAETKTSQNENPNNEKDAIVVLDAENKKAQVSDKNIKTENTKKLADVVNELPNTPKNTENLRSDNTDKLIQNILKQAKAPLENHEQKATENKDKKCNSDVQIIYNKLSDNNYYFEVKSSKDFNNYIWYMGDGFVEFNTKTLSHYYDLNEGENYIVSLVVKRDGCKDSIIQKIHISKAMKFDIHNVFTPNQDGQNEDWNIAINNPVFYNLKVIDYKGDLVFETNDANVKWNGQKQNVGENCATGSYTYLLVYKISSEENTKTLKGRLDLLR